MKNYLDIGNGVVIFITVILFVIALFTKGLSKDLLLETGVILVSAKIIIANYKNSKSNSEILKRLGEIDEKLTEMKKNPEYK